MLLNTLARRCALSIGLCGLVACAGDTDEPDRLSGQFGSDAQLGKEMEETKAQNTPAPETSLGEAFELHAQETARKTDFVPAPAVPPMSLPLGERCFPEIFDPSVPGPDYDQFNPAIGSHCLGTNHQNIEGIERVVFLGDSITQGSPPTRIRDRYRFVLGDMLEQRFGNTVEITNCAAWGARTDDLLLPPHEQIHECFNTGVNPERTLVVMTVGGNDISSLQKEGAAGRSYVDSRAEVERFVQLLREAIEWFYEDPNRFPNGVFVVFSNMFEFTDGTGDVSSCPAANLAGFAGEWPDAEELVIWANEQFMSIAVETQTDMIFMLENFCGHGFLNDDPTARCYRGPDTERWFDLTCIHPNAAGHHEIARMFYETITE